MEGSPLGILVISLLLILGTAFFVSAEYALVASRRSRIEALARKGNRGAKGAMKVLDDSADFIAVGQLGISMMGIGIGSVTEPYVSHLLELLIGERLPKAVGHIISILFVTYALVVVGELAPKYFALKAAERVLLVTYRPMQWLSAILKPLIWLTHQTTALLIRPFGINIYEKTGSAIPKEELMVLVKSGTSEGMIGKEHGELVTRALKIDQLMAKDIMVHRLDIRWLDIALDRDELMKRLKEIPFGRIPVCEGDIDEVLGIAYLHDVVKNIDRTDFSLASILRPAVTIPENLPIDRIVAQMRDSKSQILIVLDEYGGTSGLITLEDVVEEVFGELEDHLETERPPIETMPASRISARADVRFDELLAYLNLDMEIKGGTRTLAQFIVEELDRLPRPGDFVETPLGVMRVDNMARQRITRVSLQLKQEIQKANEEAS